MKKPNRLGIYETIVPELEEHRKFNQMTLAAQISYTKKKKQNRELQDKKEIDHLRNLNKIHEGRVEQLEKELQLV